MEATKNTETPSTICKVMEAEPSQSSVKDSLRVPVELTLINALEEIDGVKFLRECVKAAFSNCVYCAHASHIIVKCGSLIAHFLTTHSFTITVSHNKTEVERTKVHEKLNELKRTLADEYFNSEMVHYSKQNNLLQLDIVVNASKQLYIHYWKLKPKTVLYCRMCESRFYNLAGVLSHKCEGKKIVGAQKLKYRCCFCNKDNINSIFKLIVHVRKKHCACDMCLKRFETQGVLKSHMEEEHFFCCYGCEESYADREVFTKHMFWKHDTEGVICKRCAKKRWQFVYHFCVPLGKFERIAAYQKIKADHNAEVKSSGVVLPADMATEDADSDDEFYAENPKDFYANLCARKPERKSIQTLDLEKYANDDYLNNVLLQCYEPPTAPQHVWNPEDLPTPACSILKPKKRSSILKKSLGKHFLKYPY